MRMKTTTTKKKRMTTKKTTLSTWSLAFPFSRTTTRTSCALSFPKRWSK